MIFRQLFDSVSSTYTYLIGDEKYAVACLIDPVLEKVETYQILLRELKLDLIFAIDTHVHADHVTASGKLRELTDCKTMVGTGDVSCASESLTDGKIIKVGSLSLIAIFTPGHTDNSFTFFLETKGQGYLFTGDTLLIRGTGRTDFQNGDPAMLYNSLNEKILQFPDETRIYPGHDYKGWTVSTIGEEKEFNPRLQKKTKEEFINLMNNLNLPDPKMMDVAVPANLKCGRST